jgi:ferric-dicitrate binding protein FerR (iron transport regulator)
MIFLNPGQKVIASLASCPTQAKQSQEVQRDYHTKAEQRRIVRNDNSKIFLQKRQKVDREYYIEKKSPQINTDFCLKRG